MWFGTDNGLARFDGRQIQNFTFGDSEANRVLSLSTSMAGQLWIGTHKGGFVYSGDRIKPVPGTDGIGIAAILSDDEILFGTEKGDVLRIRTNENGEFSAETLHDDPISAADGTAVGITSLNRNDGKILIGTSGSGTLKLEDGSVSELKMTPRPLFVNALETDSSGKLWFGTDALKGISGIYSISPDSQAERVAAPTANVVALESNKSGLWAGTERYGLFRIVGSKPPKAYTFENTSGGLRSDNIFALFTDREGILWVGTNRGVSRFDPSGPIQQTVSDIPNSNFVRTFFQSGDGKDLFAGSNRGLFRLDGEFWKLVPTFRDKVIYAIGY